MSRVRIKICGITNESDARLAVQLGADALGFVFYPPSPRYIEPAHAREIVRRIPSLVTRVGVFVALTPAEAAAIGQTAGMDLLQIHAPRRGDTPEAWRERMLPVFSPSLVPAARADESRAHQLIEMIRMSGAPWFLLDNASPDGSGGTGKPVDWTLAAAAGRAGHMVLGGGLTPSNVSEAIQEANPWGVDVASGVEERPGHKDPVLLEQFFAAVQSSARKVTA
jgi:phosphoribosylanthranilate isomerase